VTASLGRFATLARRGLGGKNVDRVTLAAPEPV
jgi:hypothetical protein